MNRQKLIIPICVTVALFLLWIFRDVLKGIFLLIMLIGYIIFSPREDNCNLQIAKEVQSPDKLHKAVMYQFDCGATTPFTTNVSILDKNEKIQYESGNIFSAYHGSNQGSWQGPYAEINWKSNKELAISYISDAIITEKNNSFSNIAIIYAPIQPQKR